MKNVNVPAKRQFYENNDKNAGNSMYPGDTSFWVKYKTVILISVAAASFLVIVVMAVVLALTLTTKDSEPVEFANGKVGLNVRVRNSQNNQPVTAALVSVFLDLEIVAKDVAVDSAGLVFIPVPKNGTYRVQIKVEGFVTSEYEEEVGCSSEDCPKFSPDSQPRLVAVSPTLALGETRIIMSWETENPRDIDIHIVSVKKSDRSTCETSFRQKNSCKKINLDQDNTQGGHNGAETMTLMDSAINKDYVYLIAIEDYNFESNGTPFLSSGARIQVTNGVKTVYAKMEASYISSSTE